MKKFILGTTALIAASALTMGVASAAEKKEVQKIKLNVSGYLQTSFVVADYDTGDQLPTDIRHEGEIHFTGKTTLDNGLEFGVNVQLEARESTDQIDETFMYVEGSFGRVIMGSENSASYLMHYGSPSPVPAWGLNSPNANAGGFTTPSTYTNEISDADKITYFTPRFSGFQLGASFTPDSDEETGTGSTATAVAASPYAPIKAEGDENEGFSVAVNYVNSFNEISVAASLGYEIITTDTAGLGDTEEISVGGSVGFSGFKVGGAYKFTDEDGGAAGVERHDYNLGVTYGMGPWKVGLQYAGVSMDDTSDGELHAFVLGGQYVLGPGITAFGGIQYWDGENDRVGSEGENATIFFLGTSLSF
ncbi:MAG: porin [Sneathiella sp.]|nr:porin [Sneathiella sp.]